MSHFNDLFVLTFRASARIINCEDTGNPEFQKIKSRAFSSGGARKTKNAFWGVWVWRGSLGDWLTVMSFKFSE